MTKLIVGGWMWWVERYKLSHPAQDYDYKEMLKMYMSGTPPE